MTEEKISPPASWQRAQEEQQARRECVEEWRGHLSALQAQALEQDPYGQFVSRIPVEVLTGGSFNRQELDELVGHEEAEHRRLAPLAKAKDERRRAYVRAGGAPEAFDRQWREYGQELYISDKAAEDLERARRASSIY